jgi:nicotinate-nucleotide adenylyltransferase
MRIAIYGGSFNPPHIGHAEAARAACEALKPDKFLVIPTYVPPHKELEKNSPGPEERLEMCRLAFGDLPGVKVSDMEIKREGKSYTAETVDALMEKYPNAEICIVMGTDMFLSFKSWYRWQYMLENCTLAVLSREDFDRREIERFRDELEAEYDANIILIPHTPLPMSSTEIREKLRRGLGADQLSEAVYAYIIRKGFYDAKPELPWLRQMVMPYLKADRIAHVTGVESQAVMLAMHWGIDPETAAVAGILHDITKAQSKEKQLKLCEKYGILLEKAEKENPSLLHARTGAALAKERFGVSDEIVEAIRWHTTGKPDMNTLEKILYLADYTEPNRDFEGVEELRALCFEDLDKAMALGLQMSIDDLNERGKPIFHDTMDAYNWYKNRTEEQ